jgi:hypothetical protein
VQPQDNGVILFLHNCIEQASTLRRLYKNETDIEYINRVLEDGLCSFRNDERKKLIDHGSNSTTRSYRITGIKPCDPFSTGWRENLELYASFNGLQIDDDRCPYYGVRPKRKSICPEFSDGDINLLNETIPLLAKDGDISVTILDEPKAKCYAIANNIINNWVAKLSNERTVRPHPTNNVERLALKHMEITHIIPIEPAPDSLYLDANCQQAKRDAILNQTQPMETIQVRPKATPVSVNWSKATKMAQKLHHWSVFDGISTQEVTTNELQEEWIIDLEYDLFPNDKKVKEMRRRSIRRRRNEKSLIIKNMAKTVAEEERDAELERVYDEYMARPNKSYSAFKAEVVAIIERPSEHSVTVKLGNEDHPVKVCAHGNNTSSMSQMVIDNVCSTVVGVLNKNEKKKTKRRRGGKVNRTRRGSDGFVKIAQMDEQHQLDLLQIGEDEERIRNAKIDLCKRRLRAVRQFAKMPRYRNIWRNNGCLILDSKLLKKQQFVSLLKIYNVQGRTKIAAGDKVSIQNELRSLHITQQGIEEMEVRLLGELEGFGERDDFQVDESFGDISSVIIETDTDTCAGDVLETETSAGNMCIESDDTDELIRTVSFDVNPQIRTIPAVWNDQKSQASRRQNDSLMPSADALAAPAQRRRQLSRKNGSSVSSTVTPTGRTRRSLRKQTQLQQDPKQISAGEASTIDTTTPSLLPTRRSERRTRRRGGDRAQIR